MYLKNIDVSFLATLMNMSIIAGINVEQERRNK
jgi:hypothetical protein